VRSEKAFHASLYHCVNIAEKSDFGYDSLMKRFLVFIIVFVISCLPVHSDEIDGKTSLQKGKAQLEKKKFQDAILSLSQAEKEFQLLGDYALLWLSDAYHETGNHAESLKAVRKLLGKYPLSPLAKRARFAEIREAEEVSEDGVGTLYESYLKDFPDDSEIKFLYAGWLKKDGQKEKARAVFKDVYTDAGPFSEKAYGELTPSDITAEDLVKKASNLLKAADYRGAESDLRSAIKKDDGSLKNEILRSLGLSLFRQRKYLEAADVYKNLKDRYWEIRSLYRAGEKEKVDFAVNELSRGRDRRFGSILVALASDRRRDGDFKEALNMYRTVIDRYPSDREDALWGMGWTYLRSGENKKATGIFSKLYETYGDSKYLYWKARSLQKDGQDASELYQVLLGKEREFYTVMTYALHKESAGKSWKFVKGVSVTPPKNIPRAQRKMDRIEALIELGLSKEALSELIYVSQDIDSVEDIPYLCSKFQELGNYRYSVRLASRAPYTEELQSYLYPRVHWDIVSRVSAQYGIDPLLVLSVIREESRFDPMARSTAGAFGLMQLMPATARRFDSRLKSSQDIFGVENNIRIGVCYLNQLIKEFGSYTYAIAAYNAGEDIVRQWLKKGQYGSADQFIEDIPYDETRNYVKKVLTSFFEYKRMTATGDDAVEIPVGKL
jgi:soluble lytic murein transglycosylase